MGIIAGFLSQNVLKYLLKFGEVAPFLGYNAFTDFFPKYPMQPNTECSDLKCRELQAYYSQNPGLSRQIKQVKVEEKPKHTENEWGISLEADEDGAKDDEKPSQKT